MTSSPLVLSTADRERITVVDRLGLEERADALVALLSEKSWAVRRAVVAALARMGEPAVEPLAQVLTSARDDEAVLAAAVDALAASRGGGVTQAMLNLIARDPPPAALCDAAQILGRRRAALAVPALEGFCAHSDDNVAVAAIEALGSIGGGVGIDALVAVLASKNFFRIFPAIDVLGRSGDGRALAPLLRLLDNPRYAVEAARSLGRAGDPAAAAPLARLLPRASDALARAIAVSLTSIHARALERFGTAEGVVAALRKGGPAVVPSIARSIGGATFEEQAALCSLLAWTGDETAAFALVSLLDVTPSAAAPALRSLGTGSDPQLLQALREGDSNRRALLLPLVTSRTRVAADVLPCLSDPDVGVRVLACNALARIGDASAVPRLFELLREPDPMLTQAAVSTLQALGSATTEKLALESARAPEPHLRRAALRIVAYFGYPAALDLLIEVAEGPDDKLRDVAIQGLALLNDARGLAVLLRTAAHPNPRARAAAMRALGQSEEDGQARLTLRSGLTDVDAWVRYYACQALGKLRDDGAAEALLKLLDDPAGQVRVGAVEALAHLEAAVAIEALRAAAASADPDVQRAALLGLGSRKLAEALPALVEASKSADAATRLIALSALAPYPGPAAVAALADAASDPDASVREAALGLLAVRSEPSAPVALIGLILNPLTSARAVEALAALGSGSIPAIVSALNSAHGELAIGLIAALARMKRADAFAAIVDALSLPNVFARRASAGALAALSTAPARAALEHALVSESDAEVRRACLSGLGP